MRISTRRAVGAAAVAVVAAVGTPSIAGAAGPPRFQTTVSDKDLTVPGQYGFFCPIVGPNGIPHYKEGFVGLFDIVPA